jgi:hypothetical protein
MNITTDLERKLVGALGGFMGATSQEPKIAETVFRAAEVSQDEIEVAIKGPASDSFNCTMWNICNSAIGAPMLTHEEIMAKRGDS